jgi:two-component system KDP operon response regulator KdpE
LTDANILVVDDDPGIVQVLKDAFEIEGWSIRTVANGQEALNDLITDPPDVVLLDILMPLMDGYEACRRIRRVSSAPIIMLSAKAEEEDKVKCLTLGADDYVTKPFSLKELVARIHVALRHNQKVPVNCAFASGDLIFDFEARTVATKRGCKNLTRTENAILYELVKEAGKVLDYDYLLSNVWGPEYKEQKDYLYVHVSHLRSKLELNPDKPQYLVSVPGTGYLFSIPN